MIWRVALVVALLVLSSFALYHSRYLQRQRTTSVVDLEDSIYNATLGFQNIFVLSLPSRTDHRDWMSLSAAVSDLQFDFIDGVAGSEVADKVLPPGADRKMGDGNIGSWRAHMNAMARIVRENITSALILEDDIDWDVRIKQQMQNFAEGTRALTQPLVSDSNGYLDPSFSMARAPGRQQKHPGGEDGAHYDIYAETATDTLPAKTSPYGDDWDVLWPGSCAMHFPRLNDMVPHGRFIILNDETMVPPASYLAADPQVLPGTYPASTRVVSHVWDPICTFAYAVSQRGARKILYEYGIKYLDRAFDQMMCDFCDQNTCLAVSPQLFSHYRSRGPVNRDSDINGFGQDTSSVVRDRGWSENIQRSVRLNMEALLIGTPTYELQDQYPA